MTTVEIPSKDEDDDQPIQFCIDTILKEAKNEGRLVKQLLFTMLSAYTNNPINLAIKSPSGEGKSYVLHKVGENFPPEDVMFVAGMTDKALFHRAGKLVVKNEIGEYESIEGKILKIDSEIDVKEDEISTTKHHDLKQALQNQIKDLQMQKKDLGKNARKLIDLSHTTIVFQDTPSLGLLSALMPLLSHDKFEVEYEYVDTHNGIRTKTNLLKGWPAVILSQAIDDSHYKRYPEIQRRFIITNPKMSTEKYSDAIDLIGDKYGLPDFAYQEEIVNDADKEKTKRTIKELKDKISACVRLDPGKNNVIVPFSDALTAALPHDKAADMTIANRLFSAISLSAIINVDKRPRYVLRKDGDPIMQTIPFATFEDLRESASFTEYADGLRSYVREWYYDVFLNAYSAKTGPDSKVDSRGNALTEKMVALTTEQLAEATYQQQSKKFSTKQILETFAYPLLNQGYIDVADSGVDKRSKIYYPVISSSKNRKLFDPDQSNNFSQENRISIVNPSLYPNKEYLISKIRHICKYSSEKEYYRVKKIVSHDNREISIEGLVDAYYNWPENYFQARTISDQKEVVSDEYLQNGEIASELQIIAEEDTGYIHSSPESCEKLFDGHKSNNFLFSCYYCDYHTNVECDYESHVVMKHPGKLAYPGKAYLERLDIQPKGKSWEMYGP
jgi:hypothetical protein